MHTFCSYAKDVKIIHFLGKWKPWQHTTDGSTGVLQKADPETQAEHLQLWWDIFNQQVVPQLQPELCPHGELSTPTLDRLAHAFWTALPEDERSLSSRHVVFCPIVLQQNLSSSSLNEFQLKESKDSPSSSSFSHVVFTPSGWVKEKMSAGQSAYEEIVRKLQREAAKRPTYLVPLASQHSSAAKYSDTITKHPTPTDVGGADTEHKHSQTRLPEMTKSLNILACESDHHYRPRGQGGGSCGGGGGGGSCDNDVRLVNVPSVLARSSPPSDSPSGDGVEKPLHAEGSSSVSACYGFIAPKSDEKVCFIMLYFFLKLTANEGGRTEILAVSNVLHIVVVRHVYVSVKVGLAFALAKAKPHHGILTQTNLS
ncbi:unnamed protein product [Soboliphyme baturini]|uniref:Uncharacterized protein n=1 Tax=Soboliphyme baturini TaxID=241478 RepID=A0A3P8F0D7_9BILA|nr:unnamed protein product [Soboliphyme baturini]